MIDKGRILLVDDEEDILEFLSYNLIKEGYKIKTANNGKSALKILEKFNPDLIILDVMTVSYTHLTLPTKQAV